MCQCPPRTDLSPTIRLHENEEADEEADEDAANTEDSTVKLSARRTLL